MSALIRLVLCALLAMAVACAVPSESDQKQRPPITADSSSVPSVSLVEAPSDGEELVVSVQYLAPIEKQARVAELFIVAEGLDFVTARPGDSAEASGKTITVQHTIDGKVRIILFSPSNTTGMPSGSLAALTFHKTASDKRRIRLLNDRPLFAPAEANDGLLIGSPLEL